MTYGALAAAVERPEGESPIRFGGAITWGNILIYKLQNLIGFNLTDQVYRLTTIVPPHYRLTQSYLHAGDNPYCWFTGYCSYEVKSAWFTDAAPSRSFDKFAQ